MGDRLDLADELKSNWGNREAEEMYRMELEQGEKTMGWEHPDVLRAAHNLAEILQTQGKYEEAEELYQRVVGRMGEGPRSGTSRHIKKHGLPS